MKVKIGNLIITLSISISASLIVILFSGLKDWALLIVVLLILFGGQVFRYFLDNHPFFNKSAVNKRPRKKYIENEVKEFFDNNPVIARRFLNMAHLAEKGKYGDAIKIGNALKRERLSPTVKKYIEFKLSQYKKLEKFKSN
ncbi:MAG: hypothetical protein ACTSXU_07680 [Promethearchaeota archaeon]